MLIERKVEIKKQDPVPNSKEYTLDTRRPFGSSTSTNCQIPSCRPGRFIVRAQERVAGAILRSQKSDR